MSKSTSVASRCLPAPHLFLLLGLLRCDLLLLLLEHYLLLLVLQGPLLNLPLLLYEPLLVLLDHDPLLLVLSLLSQDDLLLMELCLPLLLLMLPVRFLLCSEYALLLKLHGLVGP